MTGCVALRKDIYYIRLTYYDREHKRKDKWVSTGLSGRGAKNTVEVKKNLCFYRVFYLYVGNRG